MKVELDVSLDELGRIVSLLKKWRKPSLPNALTTEEWAAVRSGNKIAAIKLIRERTGCGLLEAKNAVEARS